MTKGIATLTLDGDRNLESQHVHYLETLIQMYETYVTNILQTYMKSYVLIRISLGTYGIRERGLEGRNKYFMSQC